MRNLAIITALLFNLVFSSGVAQTVHKDDIDYFVGAYARTDSLDRASIDCSSFVEWMIIKPRPGERQQDLRQIEHSLYSREKQWVVNLQRKARGDSELKWNRYRRDLKGFRFYIMSDYEGWEIRANVLTVWEPVGTDSLRYYCGQVGEFDSPVGQAWVERVGVFPDSSLLLVVKLRGEGYAGYLFSRGLALCSFVEFFSRRWEDGDFEMRRDRAYINIDYDFEHLDGNGLTFQVVELTEFITFQRRDRELSKSIDSASVKVIDLWEMAKK